MNFAVEKLNLTSGSANHLQGFVYTIDPANPILLDIAHISKLILHTKSLVIYFDPATKASAEQRLAAEKLISEAFESELASGRLLIPTQDQNFSIESYLQSHFKITSEQMVQFIGEEKLLSGEELNRLEAALLGLAEIRGNIVVYANRPLHIAGREVQLSSLIQEFEDTFEARKTTTKSA